MIPDRPDRVPDSIEPFIGYRAWHFASVEDGAPLLPLMSRVSARAPGWEGANRGWVTAGCPFDTAEPLSDCMRERSEEISSKLGVRLENLCLHEPHTVPGEECSCGFYAMKDLGSLPTRWGSDVILGRVELAGKVIECTDGYRAECARIAELIAVPGNERSAKRLALLLGLPLSRAVFPPMPELPPAA